MIITGTSCGHARALGRYLTELRENDEVPRVFENFYGPDTNPVETLEDMQALSVLTKGRHGLYHMQISPEPGCGMDEVAWTRAIDTAAEEMGYADLARVSVLHVKNGRAHMHVVFQRTDVEQGVLRPDSWDYVAHERAARRVERELAHPRVPGAHVDRDPEQKRPRSAFTQGEWQQAKASGIDPRERKAQITALWQQADSGPAFVQALEMNGYVLARGDRRGFVIVDPSGQVHSLARQIDGVRAKELKARLDHLDLAHLPGVDAARELQAQHRQAQQDVLRGAGIEADPLIDSLTADTGRFTPDELDEAVRARSDGDPDAIAAILAGHPRLRAHVDEEGRLLGYALAEEGRAEEAAPEGVYPGDDDSVRPQHEQARADVLREADIDPDKLLEGLTRHHSFFTRSELIRAIEDRSAADPDPLAEIILDDAKILRLYTGEGTLAGYTTKDIRAQEEAIVARASRMAASGSHDVSAEALDDVRQRRPWLEPEQHLALSHALALGQVKIIEGRAGAGKSVTLEAIAEAARLDGYRPIGMAKTHAVVGDLRRSDAYVQTCTVDSLLHQVRTMPDGELARSIDKRSFLIVDEAAMLETGRLDQLTRLAEERGAKILLAGDHRQLHSVERGGLFGDLAGEIGSAKLTAVRRQERSWARQAAADLGDGRFREALGRFDAQGCLHWSERLESARDELVRKWAADTEQARGNRFVFAYTNAEVRELNAALQEIEIARGRITNLHEIETHEGTLRVGEGDRIAFKGTHWPRKTGITNGTLATVERIEGSEMTVRADSGRQIRFDTAEFARIRLGYAGTIYSGQGKTLEDGAYVLHTHHWRDASTYVALTRARTDTHVFVGADQARDFDRLVAQVRRQAYRGSTLQFDIDPPEPPGPGGPPDMRDDFTPGGRPPGPDSSSATAAPNAPEPLPRARRAFSRAGPEPDEELYEGHPHTSRDFNIAGSQTMAEPDRRAWEQSIHESFNDVAAAPPAPEAEPSPDQEAGGAQTTRHPRFAGVTRLQPTGPMAGQAAVVNETVRLEHEAGAAGEGGNIPPPPQPSAQERFHSLKEEFNREADREHAPAAEREAGAIHAPADAPAPPASPQRFQDLRDRFNAAADPHPPGHAPVHGCNRDPGFDLDR